MSCIVHSDKNFNRVLWSIEVYQEQKDMIKTCVSHIYDPASFIKRLHDWNHRAYSERYGEPVDIPAFKPCSESPKLSPVELLKLLQSIDYQCSDSTDYRQSGDREVLRDTVSSLQGLIISRLPEYEAAAWW